MNVHILYLAFICHILPQDSNAQRSLGSCSTRCQNNCILYGYNGGFCLPLGQWRCSCKINGRVVGPVVDMTKPARVPQLQRASYFPSHYFDPYQPMRRTAMMELPHPHLPPPILGSGQFMNSEISEPDQSLLDDSSLIEPAEMPGYFPQQGFLPVETMSADSLETVPGETKNKTVDTTSADTVILQTKPNEIKKETDESIGINIGAETPAKEGQRLEMSIGSNSTEYLPPNGTEEKPDLPDAPAKKPSGDDQNDGRAISTDSSGKFIENKMTVNVANPETSHDVELELGNKVGDEEENGKAEESEKEDQKNEVEPMKSSDNAEDQKAEKPEKGGQQNEKETKAEDQKTELPEKEGQKNDKETKSEDQKVEDPERELHKNEKETEDSADDQKAEESDKEDQKNEKETEDNAEDQKTDEPDKEGQKNEKETEDNAEDQKTDEPEKEGQKNEKETEDNTEDQKAEEPEKDGQKIEEETEDNAEEQQAEEESEKEPKNEKETKSKDEKSKKDAETKTRRKRNADKDQLSQSAANDSRRKFLREAEHKIAERRKLLDTGEKKIAQEREWLKEKENKILEERKLLDQKEGAEKSGKSDLDNDGGSKRDLEQNKTLNVSNDGRLSEIGDKKVAEDKQSPKDDKAKEDTTKTTANKKRKVPADPDAVTDRKVTKTLGKLDSMLDEMGSLGAAGKFLSSDQDLFPDSIFR